MMPRFNPTSTNSNRGIFLDTSIQIERLIGPAARRVMIEQQLDRPDFNAVTSHYVLMEFQRSVVADYVHVYNQILHFTAWHEIAQAVRSGPVAHRPRALGRCLQILTEIMVLSQLQRNDALGLLLLEIKRNLLRRFWHNVTPLPNVIVCDLVEIGLTEQLDASYSVAKSCRKQTAACHLPGFLEGQRANIELIIDYLAAHPRVIKNQARVEEQLATICHSPHDALGQATCWPLGDVIILLQIPANMALWTQDPDFGALAAALDIPLYSPSV